MKSGTRLQLGRLAARRRGVDFRVLLAIPSFYGAATWIFWYALYEARVVEWQPASLLSRLLFVSVGLLFVIATAISYRGFKKTLNSYAIKIYDTDLYATYLFHVIGLVGIVVYVRDFSEFFGGLIPMMAILASVGESYQIREAAEQVTSVGFQLTYFGWFGAGLSVVFAALGRGRGLHVALIVVQLTLNLLFIDRTRPIWILFTSVYILLLLGREIDRTKLTALAVTGFVSSFGLFVLLGVWSGKLWNVEQLSDSFENISIYGTGGFAYFDHVMRVEQPDSLLMERTLYPLYKILAALGLTGEPPPQVNEFYLLPVPTNVGTILEPLYRDGGLFLVLIGMGGLVTLCNGATRWMLARSSAMNLYLCSNLAFILLMGFFTPKQSSVPIWLMAAIVGANVLVRRNARRFVRTDNPVRLRQDSALGSPARRAAVR